MASAVLANRNEPNWPQHRGGGTGFMGKIPKSNPNPNPKFAKRTHSDDASSINRRPNDANHSSQYVTFNVATCTKKEIVEIKNRLVSELEQIRRFQSRVESGEFQPRLIKKPTSKKVSGTKRPIPLPLNSTMKDLKRSNSEIGNLMKGCSQILQKLMKHKHGWIFNVPVDVTGMGLHDYYDIIKKPMDLGTVKTNLATNVYSTPSDFADDVRLTFNNALTYNPKGHDVYAMAEQLMVRFEELYRPIHDKIEDLLREDRDFDDDLPASSWNHVEPERERVKKKENLSYSNSTIPQANLQHEQPLQLHAAPASSSNPPIVQSPVRTPSPMRVQPVKPLKQPKPKAKDPNKREMSLEEKHKLGLGLQSLPPEKMEQVVQIIRKRNGHLKQDEDEIELDIEAVDIETLWELDRLVTNYKKMVSKIKRQALMVNVNNNVTSNKSNGGLPAFEKVSTTEVEVKKAKRVEAAGDEDVDIGDEIPMSMFPPVEIEKDKDVGGGHASGSSSSSSSSSSDSSSTSGINTVPSIRLLFVDEGEGKKN
ncbi:unnamed protein product [Lupinus luteus]|uniref:Uncharacterized protein n=1 Tax=Lupinus luteus TaxID=3873 RepID=A0AAV1VVE9_LUPLU